MLVRNKWDTNKIEFMMIYSTISNKVRKRDRAYTRASAVMVVAFLVAHVPRFVANILELIFGLNFPQVSSKTFKWSLRLKYKVFEKLAYSNYLKLIMNNDNYFFHISCVTLLLNLVGDLLFANMIQNLKHRLLQFSS